MSEQQLKAFLEQVKVDAGLQERLNGADPYAVFAIAQERGFMDSGDNLELVKPVLSESELEASAGGASAGGAFSSDYPCILPTIKDCET